MTRDPRTHELLLGNAAPVASGSTRDVYVHPEDERLLVKVIRRSAIAERFGKGQPWYKSRRRRYKHFISFLREIREQLAIDAATDKPPAFLQRIVGLEQTDLGPALVVRAERTADGRLAPTLTQIIRNGDYDAEAARALARFVDDITNSPVIIGDLHIHNLVYADKPGIGKHFVMIDGIGFKTLVPLERVSRAINRYNTRQRTRRLLAKVERLLREHDLASPAASGPARLGTAS